MVVTGFYMIAFSASLLLLLMMIRNKEYISGISFTFATVLMFHDLGRLVITSSTVLNTALIGQRMLNIGSVFLPYFLLLTVARFSRIKLVDPVKLIMLIYSVVVVLLTATIGHSEIYYKNVRLVRYDGYSVITKEYGPAHVAYTVLIIIYTVLLLGLALNMYMKRRDLPAIILGNLMSMAAAVIFFYFLDRILKLPVALTSIAYLYSAFVMLYLMKRIDVYDIMSCIALAEKKLDEEAYIIFDMKKRFINATEGAKRIFPELTHFKSGMSYKEVSREFGKGVVDLLDGNDLADEVDERLLKVGEEYYKLRKSAIFRGYGRNKRLGYLIDIEDVTASNNYLNALNKYNQKLEEMIETKKREIRELGEKLVLGIATVVESRDNSTGEHIVKTNRIVRIFAEALRGQNGLSDDFLNYVCAAAPMHDLGKIAIDDRILRKKGDHDENELNEIKKHAAEGARVVRKVLSGREEQMFCQIAANLANYHHEHWNGSGYPEGLMGEDIPVEARIMCLADGLDSLLSNGSDGTAAAYDKAFETMEAGLGTLYDPILGKRFIDCKPLFKDIYCASEEK